jgi:hypothetical protein
LAYPLRRLGYLALKKKEIPKAWRYFKESLIVNLEVGDQRAVAASLASLAVLAISSGKAIAAGHLYGVVENRLESLSMNLLYMDQAELRQFLNKMPTYLAKETFTTAFTRGWEMSQDQVIELVWETFDDLELAP